MLPNNRLVCMSISSFPSAFENTASFDPKNHLQWRWEVPPQPGLGFGDLGRDHSVPRTGLSASRALYHQILATTVQD